MKTSIEPTPEQQQVRVTNQERFRLQFSLVQLSEIHFPAGIARHQVDVGIAPVDKDFGEMGGVVMHF